MSLLRYISGKETLDDFERAVVSRQRDASRLRTAERAYWAIYTLGYVAEVSLKVAFFRLCGIGSRDDVEPWLRLARGWARQLGVGEPRNLHDLLFWLQLLSKERQFVQRPFSPAFSVQLHAHVQLIARHWRADMRYRASIPAAPELRRVAASVAWLVHNRVTLWR